MPLGPAAAVWARGRSSAGRGAPNGCRAGGRMAARADRKGPADAVGGGRRWAGCGPGAARGTHGITHNDGTREGPRLIGGALPVSAAKWSIGISRRTDQTRVCIASGTLRVRREGPDRSLLLVDRCLERLAGPEDGRPAALDLQRAPGPRIAPSARPTFPHLEAAEANQGDAVLIAQRPANGAEYSFNRTSRILLRQAGLRRNGRDELPTVQTPTPLSEKGWKPADTRTRLRRTGPSSLLSPSPPKGHPTAFLVARARPGRRTDARESTRIGRHAPPGDPEQAIPGRPRPAGRQDWSQAPRGPHPAGIGRRRRSPAVPRTGGGRNEPRTHAHAPGGPIPHGRMPSGLGRPENGILPRR